MNPLVMNLDDKETQKSLLNLKCLYLHIYGKPAIATALSVVLHN